MILNLSPVNGVWMPLAQTTVPDGIPTLTLWLAAMMTITTVITQLIKQLPPHFNALAKQVICALVSAALAAITVAYEGNLDTGDWGRTWLVIFAGATTLYAVIAKGVAPVVMSQQK